LKADVIMAITVPNTYQKQVRIRFFISRPGGYNASGSVIQFNLGEGHIRSQYIQVSESKIILEREREREKERDREK